MVCANNTLIRLPLLSLEGLVDKERQLAGLQLEEKEREAELWKDKFRQLQASSFIFHVWDKRNVDLTCQRKITVVMG